MKSLLIIHPDGNIYDNHNFYEMVEFLRKSYKITVLTVTHKGRKNKHNDEFGRHIIYYFRGWRRLFQCLDSNILRYIFLNIYLFGRRKYDLIIGVDRESIIQASIFSKITKTPYALLSYEIFFEDETGAKFKQKERQACQNIAFAIVQDELRREHLCEQNHIPKEKVMLMPVAAGVAKSHSNTYFLHDHLHIPRDKKILLYAGSIDGWSGFPALLYILESMLPDDWVFVIHFKCPGIAQSKPNFELSKIYFSEVYLPTYRDFSKLLYSADLGLVCYYPDFMDVYRGKNIGYIGLSSGKFNTYLQHGLPVLAIYPSYLANLTQQYKLGIGTTDLRKIDLTSFKKEEYEQNCLKFFDEILSFETCKDELIQHIENALGGGVQHKPIIADTLSFVSESYHCNFSYGHLGNAA